MPEKRLQKTRDNYKDDLIPWCIRHNKHMMLNGICMACKKTEAQIRASEADAK